MQSRHLKCEINKSQSWARKQDNRDKATVGDGHLRPAENPAAAEVMLPVVDPREARKADQEERKASLSAPSLVGGETDKGRWADV